MKTKEISRNGETIKIEFLAEDNLEHTMVFEDIYSAISVHAAMVALGLCDRFENWALNNEEMDFETYLAVIDYWKSDLETAKRIVKMSA